MMTRKADYLDKPQMMQRLKVGLSGLGAVLLLIGMASAVFNSVNRERPVNAVGGARTATVEAMTGNGLAPAGPANEPLAELGVAPPTATGNESAAR